MLNADQGISSMPAADTLIERHCCDRPAILCLS
jgi:hypothetical protein